MRADIQFSKFGKERTKSQQILIVTFYTLAILCIAFAGVVLAYFTASAQLKKDTSFGRISVAFLDTNDSVLTDANFDTKLVKNLTPGDIIDLSNIKIKNTSTHEAYVLVNVDISIEKTGATTLHYNKWYDIYGQEVNTNFSSNATAPTMLARGATATTNIKWTVPGEVVDANYGGATAKITMTAYGSQTNLQRTNTYVNPELYASYYICKTAVNMSEDTTGRNLFNKGATPILSYSADQTREVTDTGLILTNKSSIKSIMSVYSIGPVENYNGETIYLNTDVKLNNVSSASIGLGYANADGSDRNISVQTISTDGSYQKSLTIDASSHAGKVVAVCLYSHYSNDVSAVVGSSVEYSNIMVSVGDHDYSTYYENYTGAEPSGDPLMKVGNVEDTIDYNTGTITRNIAKIEFTGEESLWYEYTNGSEGKSFQYGRNNIGGLTDKKKAVQTSLCSHYSNVSYAWDVQHCGNLGIYSDHYETYVLYFRAPKNRSDIDTLDEWKAWLAGQYANGTPVTVWYQLATPTTEYTTASKNIYQGTQNRHFATDADNNTSGIVAYMYVASDLSYVPANSTTTVSLGSEIFEVMWNNPTVLSYKIKRTANDIVKSSFLSVTYYNYSGGSSSSLGSDSTMINTYSNDGGYHLMYISLPALSTLYNGQVSYMRFTLADTGGNTTRDFSIKDIQIEIGESPTDYEPYEKAIYTYVNGKALYTTGDTFDTYNGSTKTITRNVNTYEFDTAKNYGFVNNSDGNHVSVYMNNSQFINPPPVDTYNAKILCSHLNYRFDQGYYADRTNEGIMGTGDYSAAFMMTFAVSRVGETEEDFESWVARERANGTSLMIYFAMATPTTETA